MKELTPTGLEHPADSNGKSHISGTGGAESGALCDQNAPKPPFADPDLQAIVDAWPSLDHNQRRQVRMLAQSMTPTAGESGAGNG